MSALPLCERIQEARDEISRLPSETRAACTELVDTLEELTQDLGRLRMVFEDECVSATLIAQYEAFDRDAISREAAEQQQGRPAR